MHNRFFSMQCIRTSVAIAVCILLGTTALLTTGCRDTIKKVKQTAQVLKDSPRPAMGNARSVHLVDSGTGLGFTHDIAVINDMPVLAYRAPDGLRFAQATVPHPVSAADWQIHIVDSTDRAGGNVMLVVTDGRPLLIYNTGSRNDSSFRFAVATDTQPASGEDWMITKFASFHVAIDASVIDGRPAFLTFVTSDTRDLAYVQATCAVPLTVSDWISTVVTADGLRMGDARLTSFDDRPLVLASDAKDFTLYAFIAKPAQPEKALSWQRETICDPQKVYLSLSDTGLAVVAGQPVATYSLSNSFVLNYAWRSVDSAGHASWQSSPVLSWQDGSSGLDLIEVDGRPLLAYSFWAQAFAIHADSATPASPKDWQMSFATDDVSKGDYRKIHAAYIDGKVVMSIFGFDTGQGEGLFFSVVD